MKGYRFFQKPEINLGFLSFFLNFFWEVIHTYFYEFRESAFNHLIYGWLHCTLGDVIITVGAFWLVSLINRNRRWFLSLSRMNFVGFIMIGVVYTFFSEQANVHLYRSWAYNESMPIIPWTGVGLLPVIQWMVVPTVTILILRHYCLLVQKAEEKIWTQKVI